MIISTVTMTHLGTRCAMPCIVPMRAHMHKTRIMHHVELQYLRVETAQVPMQVITVFDP